MTMVTCVRLSTHVGPIPPPSTSPDDEESSGNVINHRVCPALRHVSQQDGRWRHLLRPANSPMASAFVSLRSCRGHQEDAPIIVPPSWLYCIAIILIWPFAWLSHALKQTPEFSRSTSNGRNYIFYLSVRRARAQKMLPFDVILCFIYTPFMTRKIFSMVLSLAWNMA